MSSYLNTKLKAIEIVKLEPKDRLIKAIWVHQHKFDADGHLLNIKSLLCPQRFRYRPNIDFNPDIIALCTTCTDNLGLFDVRGSAQYVQNSPRR